MSRRRPAQTTAMSCGVCGATVADVYVCRDCMDRYHGHLARVPGVVADLRIEHARLAVKGGQVAGRGAGEQPLPYVPAASDAMTGLYTALTTACRALALDGDLPEPGFTSVCAWLAEREASIPLRAEGPDIVAELDAAMARAMRVCDNPPERALRGRCACGDELRSRPGAETVQCPGCGTSYRGDVLDDARDAAVRDRLAPWVELMDYGHGALRIPRGTLDSWRRRGRLQPITSGMGGEPLYSVGSMIDLHAQQGNRAAG